MRYVEWIGRSTWNELIIFNTWTCLINWSRISVICLVLEKENRKGNGKGEVY